MKLLFASLFFAAFSFAEPQTSPQDQFREALYAEEVSGDTSEALKRYRKLTQSLAPQRQLAARALYRQAECLRKLDRDDEATVTYQKLLSQYPDQKDLAKLASENLQILGKAPAPADSKLSIQGPENRRIAELEELLKHSPDLLNSGSEKDGATPLMNAAGKGHLRVAAFLLDSGADISRNKGGVTPLQKAASSGHKSMCELLITRGANLETEGRSALSQALTHRRSSIVTLLLSKGVKPDSATIIDALAAKSPLQTIMQLVESGADLNEIQQNRPNNNSHYNHNFKSPLSFAISQFETDNLPVIKLLLKSGANPNLQTENDGSTVLDLAILRRRSGFSERKHSKEIITALLEAGADFNKASTRISHNTILASSPHILQKILTAYSTLEISNTQQLQLTNLAVVTAQPACLQVLLENDYQLGPQALTKAILMLFPSGTSTNLPENANDLLAVIDLILTTKPDLEHTLDHLGPLQTLCARAFLQNHKPALPLLEKLLEAGADPNANSLQKPKLRYRTNPNANFVQKPKRYQNNTPLALILNARDPQADTDTPISVAAIRLLLKNGANPRFLDSFDPALFLNRDSQLRPGASETFPLLWEGAHYNLQKNPNRSKGLWLSQGLTALEKKQEPTFHCLFSDESASGPVTLKQFLHLANLEPNSKLNLSSKQTVTISRLGNGKTQEYEILFTEHLKSNKVFMLQWGDIIEVPALSSSEKNTNEDVITFFDTPLPIDIHLTFGDNQTVSTTNTSFGPVFRFLPKSNTPTSDELIANAGIVPFFLTKATIQRPDPTTTLLANVDGPLRHGDLVHFSVSPARPGPVTTNGGFEIKICQSLDGPFWQIPNHYLSSHPTILPFLKDIFPWLPKRGGHHALLLSLSQPHGLPLQPIDWSNASLQVNGVDEPMPLSDFFFSETVPTASRIPQSRGSFTIILPPSDQSESPFPEEFKAPLLEALSTKWNLKLGMNEPLPQTWIPRFPSPERDNGKTLWTIKPPYSPALPLVEDILRTNPLTPHQRQPITLFKKQKILRIDPEPPTRQRVRPRPQSKTPRVRKPSQNTSR